jgi:hypothetical protein
VQENTSSQLPAITEAISTSNERYLAGKSILVAISLINCPSTVLPEGML